MRYRSIQRHSRQLLHLNMHSHKLCQRWQLMHNRFLQCLRRLYSHQRPCGCDLKQLERLQRHLRRRHPNPNLFWSFLRWQHYLRWRSSKPIL